jgi:hypothetical protein
LNEIELSYTKIKKVATDGAPSMIEKRTVLWVESGQKWTKKTQNFTWIFTASSTNSHFVEKL